MRSVWGRVMPAPSRPVRTVQRLRDAAAGDDAPERALGTTYRADQVTTAAADQS